MSTNLPPLPAALVEMQFYGGSILTLKGEVGGAPSCNSSTAALEEACFRCSCARSSRFWQGHNYPRLLFLFAVFPCLPYFWVWPPRMLNGISLARRPLNVALIPARPFLPSWPLADSRLSSAARRSCPPRGSWRAWRAWLSFKACCCGGCCSSSLRRMSLSKYFIEVGSSRPAAARGRCGEPCVCE